MECDILKFNTAGVDISIGTLYYGWVIDLLNKLTNPPPTLCQLADLSTTTICET